MLTGRGSFGGRLAVQPSVSIQDGDNLNDIDAFTTFQQDLLQRCDRGHGPNARQATLVGSYRFDLTEKDRS